jgi:hypothetical protein
MVAYGTTVVLLALVSGIAARSSSDGNSLTTYDWRRIGIGAAIAVAVVLLVSYLFGGYVAGRMARRAGSVNGFLVFVLGLVVVAVAAAIVGAQTDRGAVVDSLRRAGVPTTGREWSDIGTFAGIASLAAMLVGSVLGGLAGERWHGKLVARAMNPDIGPEADARRAEAEARARRLGTTGPPAPERRTPDEGPTEVVRPGEAVKDRHGDTAVEREDHRGGTRRP